jgi:hypothetical protein
MQFPERWDALSNSGVTGLLQTLGFLLLTADDDDPESTVLQ